jgi:molybdopterin-guanine dinucleotide biosynthesis protein A
LEADFSVRPETVIAVVLAGGRSRRMGGGLKALEEIAGRSLLARVLDRLPDTLGAVVLNVNEASPQIAQFGLPVITDEDPDARLGPLAGILAGLEWAEACGSARWLLVVPSDAPFLPRDLLERLADGVARDHVPLAVAGSAGRVHPVIGLWSTGLRGQLRRALVEDGERKAGRVVEALGAINVPWSAEPFDPFMNINAPTDLLLAERIVTLQ